MDSINKKSPFSQLIFPIVIQVTIIVIALIIVIDGQTRLANTRDIIDIKNATISLHDKINNIINTGRNIEALYKASEEVSQDEFNEFASIVVNGTASSDKSITMQWVDEKNFVRYVYPLNEDNQKAVGFNNNLYPNRMSILSRAKSSHSPLITEPLMLIQGYPGVIIYVPIFKGDIYLGTAVSLVKLSDFFSVKNIQAPNASDYRLITDNTIYPFDSNHLYSNKGYQIDNIDGSLGTKQETLISKFEGYIEQDFIVLNNDWKIETLPYNLNILYSTIYLYCLGGIVVAFAFGLMIYKVYSKQTQLAAAYINQTKVGLELEEEVVKRKIAEEVLNLKNKSLEDSQKELKKRNEELEKINKIMVDREIKMTVLKKELEELKEEKIKKEDKPPI